MYATEKSLKDYGDKVSQGDRANIEQELNSLKEAIKNNNAAGIKSGIDTLSNAWNEASSQMYQQATAGGTEGGAKGQEGPQADAGGPGKPEERKVEDASYEVVDDKDKK